MSARKPPLTLSLSKGANDAQRRYIHGPLQPMDYPTGGRHGGAADISTAGPLRRLADGIMPALVMVLFGLTMLLFAAVTP